jgi:hypothetical protein
MITETFLGLLGDYQNSNNVFFPNKYQENKNTLTHFETITKKENIDYSPHVAQPNQKYRQIHPDEYPTKDDSEFIQTPLSTHESIVNQLRNKLEY